ncbi:MAG: TonB-dependent receptor, partial [Methylococcales bacterium]
DTRLHASYGTGVKNPTLFELFGFLDILQGNPFQGNPDLQAEESQSFDVGIEQQFLNGRVALDTTYYNNRIENLITGFGQTSINQTGRAHISGIEVAMRANIIDSLDFTGSYTWNSNKDADGVSLVRRPKHIASANLNYGFNAFGKPGNLNIGVKYNGKQTDFAFDQFFNRSTVELEDYTLLNIAASYEIYEQVELFARVENLLDEHYQEVNSFAARGIAGYGGIRVTFGPFL